MVEEEHQLVKHGVRVCQVCGDSLLEGDLVYCAYCKTPHHHDCWQYTRQCSTYGCGCRHCIDSPPKDGGAGPGDDKVIKIDGEGFGWLAGRKVRLSIKPSERLVNLGSARHSGMNEFSNSYSRLDIDTMLENFITALAIFVLLAGILFGLRGPIKQFDWQSIQLGLFLSTILMFVRMFIDCTYVLDNRSRLLLYSRSIFGFTSTWKICEFSEIVSLGISAEKEETDSGQSIAYSIVLELPTHTCIAVSEPETDFDKVDGYATVMATHLETKLLTTIEEVSSLEEKGYDIPMTSWCGDWESWLIFGRPDWWEIAYFISITFSSAVVLITRIGT